MKRILAVFLLSSSLTFLFPEKAHAQENYFYLPQPSGEFRTAFIDFEVKDNSRRDLLHMNRKRVLSLSLYYPTSNSEGSSEFYISDTILLQKMTENGYNHLDKAQLKQLGKIKTNSIRGAKISNNQKFPLIIFSHGLGVSRKNYTMFAEELASHGNLVLTVDHPYGGFSIANDRILRTQRQDTLLYSESARNILDQRIKEWEQDIVFLLDQITGCKIDLKISLCAAIDEKRIAVIGHSLGGNVAINVAESDNRVKAGINLDGGSFGMTEKAPSVPTLTLRSQPVYSEEEIKAKGFKLEEWAKLGAEIDSAFAEILKGSKLSYEIKILGTGHMSFSDAPFVLPEMISKFGGKIIQPKKGFFIISESINIFLNSTFKKEKPNFSELLKNCKECIYKEYVRE